MTYNKSEIMKRAWDEFKNNGWCKFKDALRYAWELAKKEVAAAKAKAEREKGTVDASEIREGDIVAIEYGDYSNHLTCTIAGISQNSICGHSFYVFNAVSQNGTNREFCVDFGRRVRKIAA